MVISVRVNNKGRCLELRVMEDNLKEPKETNGDGWSMFTSKLVDFIQNGESTLIEDVY